MRELFEMDMRKIKYREEQKFGSMSLYLSMGIIYAIVIVIFIMAIYSQFVLNEPWGDKPMSNKGLLLAAFLILLVLLLSAFFLFGSKLVVVITNNDIHLTFKPILKNKIIFSRNEISSFEVRKYKPIKEYGGWGIKQGKKTVGKAYNVHGNLGLQLYLKNGKKVLIGTQRGEAIARAMTKMMENK